MAIRPTTTQEREKAKGLQLMPWHEVAAEYERRTGEKMTRSNAWLIGESAKAKLCEGLKGVAKDFGIIQ